MKKHKLCIGLDEDGHFMVSNFEDRHATFDLLKQLEDGETLRNVSSNMQSPPFFEDITRENILSIGIAKYLELVYSCTSRGKMEVIEVTL